MTFHSQHHPLGTYFDALAGGRLLVETLSEPPIDEEFLGEDESELRWRRLPLYLFVKARKGG
jgi:hypothetical protein